LLTKYRVDDESALRAKVDEAMNVYEDYMKNRGEGGANGTKEEDVPATESAEPTAA